MTNPAMNKVADCVSSLMKELSRESDRGSVVLAVAWIDEHLTMLIKSFLVAPLGSKDKDELIGVGRPIGDFGVKIQLAYRLGLIRKNTCRSLDLFRRLRNDFAHLSSPLTFETPSVSSRIREIFRLNEQILETVWDSIQPGIDREEVKPNEKVDALLKQHGLRFVFELCAATTAGGLLLTLSQVEPLMVLE